MGQVACSTRSSPASAPPRGEEPTTKGAKHAKGEGKVVCLGCRQECLGLPSLPDRWHMVRQESPPSPSLFALHSSFRALRVFRSCSSLRIAWLVDDALHVTR